MYLNSPEPILFNDEQMREYIANGYVILRPSVPDEVHRSKTHLSCLAQKRGLQRF